MKRNRYHKANEVGRKKRRCFSFRLKDVSGNLKVGSPAKAFYISRKRSGEDFVLVRLLGTAHFCITRLLSIDKRFGIALWREGRNPKTEEISSSVLSGFNGLC